MSRKHNKPRGTPAEQSGEKSRLERRSPDSLERIQHSDESTPQEALNLQRTAGNRAALETLEARSHEQEQESEGPSETPDKGVEKTKSPEVDQPQKTSKASNRAVRRRMKPSNSSESDWGFLHGGDDDATPPPRRTRPRGSSRRSLQALISTTDSPRATAEKPDSIDHSPMRPRHPEAGYRRYYALSNSLLRPARWINPDRSPESLGGLPRNHPLMRLQRCLDYWSVQAYSPLSKLLVEWAQNDPLEVGHLTRLVRSLGLLHLIQELEAQRLGVEKTADLTALLLQEKAIDDVRRLDEGSAPLLATQDLFLNLLPERCRSLPQSEPGPVTEQDTCPLTSAALQQALPAPALPAVSTPYVAPKHIPDPELKALEELFVSLWEPSAAPPERAPVSDSAEHILEACAERRCWYAALAYALWRCRGDQTAAGLHKGLVDADQELRGIAMETHRIHTALQDCSTTAEILGPHKALLTCRHNLQELDHRVRSTLISASSKTVASTHAAEPTVDNELHSLLHRLVSPKPQHGAEKTIDLQRLSSAERLLWSWAGYEQGPTPETLLKHLREGDNPWLEMRWALHRVKGRDSTPVAPHTWQGDAQAEELWSACLKEVCQDPLSKS